MYLLYARFGGDFLMLAIYSIAMLLALLQYDLIRRLQHKRLLLGDDGVVLRGCFLGYPQVIHWAHVERVVYVKRMHWVLVYAGRRFLMISREIRGYRATWRDIADTARRVRPDLAVPPALLAALEPSSAFSGKRN